MQVTTNTLSLINLAVELGLTEEQAVVLPTAISHAVKIAAHQLGETWTEQKVIALCSEDANVAALIKSVCVRVAATQEMFA